MLRAVNEIGKSAFSDIIQVALVNPPVKPATPIKLNQLSTTTSLTIKWDKNIVS